MRLHPRRRRFAHRGHTGAGEQPPPAPRRRLPPAPAERDDAVRAITAARATLSEAAFAKASEAGGRPTPDESTVNNRPLGRGTPARFEDPAFLDRSRVAQQSGAYFPGYFAGGLDRIEAVWVGQWGGGEEERRQKARTLATASAGPLPSPS